MDSLRGHSFDQLILFDDERWVIKIKDSQKLKVFVVTRKEDWCEDDAIAVLTVNKLHPERCARCNSSYFAKGEVIVTELKADKEKVILILNVGA